MRLAVLATHPIQYQAPLFRRLARASGVNFTALFCHDHGVKPTFDKQFGRVIQYDVPLLDGYSYRFLRNYALRPAVSPTGVVNPGVLRSLATGEFDAIIVYGYNTITSLLTHFGPRRRTRILLHGESHLLPHRPLPLRIAKLLFIRSVFARVDHFLPVGTCNRAYYESYGVAPDRMTFAPYSVDNDHFERGASESRRNTDATRVRLGLPPTLPLFLFCAKLIEKKRPLDALRAFARVRAQTPCGLVYAGDGALALELDREIERLRLRSDVYRLGFRNQSELPAIYGACDVLVLPSDDEPWGLVVNEAMAAGMTPVVSDNVGSGPDLVESEHIFRTGDVDALAAILKRLATYPNELATAKERATDRIERWGLAQTTDGFLRGAEAALRA